MVVVAVVVVVVVVVVMRVVVVGALGSCQPYVASPIIIKSTIHADLAPSVRDQRSRKSVAPVTSTVRPTMLKV